MTGFIKWILLVLVLAGLVSFTLLNRGDVTLNWFPVLANITLPISLLVLIVFAKGFIVGGMMVWLDGGARRTELRQLRKYKKQQEKQAEQALSSEHHALVAPYPPATPE